jgi:hypothetical protein
MTFDRTRERQRNDSHTVLLIGQFMLNIKILFENIFQTLNWI